MKFIAHRGFWIDESEKNTQVAFERALGHGFGIETDVRDFNGALVISHDIADSEAMTYRQFVDIVNRYPAQDIAMNIKADGLQSLLESYNFINKNYVYYFDMSVPDAIGFNKNNMIFFTRYSDVERQACLLEFASGVWLDNFSGPELDVSALDSFIAAGKKVTLVSPELHRFEFKNYWMTLKHYLQRKKESNPLISLCTDFPTKAKEFFIR